MKLGICGMLAALAISSCTTQQAKTVADLTLTASQIGCVMASELTDSEAIALACRIDEKLLPILRQLVAAREGAKRVGVQWHTVQ